MCASEFNNAHVQIELMRALRSKASSDGLLLLQAFGDEHDSHAEGVLTESGFNVTANMLFMGRTVTEADRNMELDKRIRWIPHCAEHHEDFVRTVERSYAGTLDCSKLGEIRDVRLTLEAYRGRGEFDPKLWLLGAIEGVPAALILLIHHPDEKVHEVAYMAVVPEHRGKGLGHKVMEKGLFEVALRAPGSLVSLAVDEANVPAVKLYSALGFAVTERRRVYFSVLATS
jgi:ribosomal protein S18 acetylase RimI-like enzyme